MSAIKVQLTLCGRPLANETVSFADSADALRTDERGHIEVDLPDGKHNASVTADGEPLDFEVVTAPGLSRVRVDLRETERPIDDPRVLEAMPADRYVPLKLLGRGGAGVVYRCRDVALDRLVAIKILNEDLAGGTNRGVDVLAEARVLAKVENPHLLQIYDFGYHRDRAYMVVQYIDGPNLEELVYAEGRLSPGSTAAAAVQLARALLAVHEAGLVHCDVKPGNGLVDRRGVVRLADFGLVRPLVDYADPRSRVFGTPAYMSPEQLQGRPLGPAGDVYSLGASIYDLATGQPPFVGNDLVLAHCFDPPPDLCETLEDAPPDLAQLVIEMMAKDAEKRPHIAEVIQRLLPLSTSVAHRDDLAYQPRLSTPTLGLAVPGSVVPSQELPHPTPPRDTDQLFGNTAIHDTEPDGRKAAPLRRPEPSVDGPERRLTTSQSSPAEEAIEAMVPARSSQRALLLLALLAAVVGAAIALLPRDQSIEDKDLAADVSPKTDDEPAEPAEAVALADPPPEPEQPVAEQPAVEMVDYSEVAGLRGQDAAVQVQSQSRLAAVNVQEVVEREAALDRQAERQRVRQREVVRERQREAERERDAQREHERQTAAVEATPEAVESENVTAPVEPEEQATEAGSAEPIETQPEPATAEVEEQPASHGVAVEPDETPETDVEPERGAGESAEEPDEVVPPISF